ncbi:class I SAM-dependent methyltransferase [Pseudonocardia lacus]|uniref:class I SAM-dependent methyltransferase n=1 Tax=Pseudonocardia lacus TaxID=2835865 RepID=UPI001BDD06B9|nr:class I SAM-dependent methyltransferase [Pseudonocardia lacus]
MNTIHNRLCRSNWWHRVVGERLLPWALRDVDLGDEVLEIGPGFGATTRRLARRVPALTAVEIDPALAARLRRELGGDVRVVEGDGSDLPFPDGAFTGVVCFTMLHHVPSARRQDMLFAQAHRVLAPGGTFAGSDSTVSRSFRLLHVGDTMVPLDPATLGDRLAAAGFVDVAVSTAGRSLRFRARKP